jgi:hypothetical protein
MTMPAATTLAIPVFDELSVIEQRAAYAKKGWVRLLLLTGFCLQVAVSTFAWRAWADAHRPPPPPPMPDQVLGAEVVLQGDATDLRELHELLRRDG